MRHRTAGLSHPASLSLGHIRLCSWQFMRIYSIVFTSAHDTHLLTIKRLLNLCVC
jgi:hypothetical protein